MHLLNGQHDGHLQMPSLEQLSQIQLQLQHPHLQPKLLQFSRAGLGSTISGPSGTAAAAGRGTTGFIGAIPAGTYAGAKGNGIYAGAYIS